MRKRERKREKENERKIRQKEREKREKERNPEKKREKERNRERKERKGEKMREKMSRVYYYPSAFNWQKEKLNILAEMLAISKSGCCCADLYIIDHRHYKSSCRS